jgi:hypothetical protein
MGEERQNREQFLYCSRKGLTNFPCYVIIVVKKRKKRGGRETERIDFKKALEKKVYEITDENGLPQIEVYWGAFSSVFDNIDTCLDTLLHYVNRLRDCLFSNLALQIDSQFLPYKQFLQKYDQFLEVFGELQQAYTEFEFHLIDLLIDKGVLFVDHSD